MLQTSCDRCSKTRHTPDSYARVVAPSGLHADESAGWLRVSAWPGGEHALKLELHGLRSSRLLEIETKDRVRKKE